MSKELTIEKVDPKEFGLQEQKVTTIAESFVPKLVERDGYIEVYKQILTKEISEEVCKEARELRLKLVKVRTGIDAIHKTEKALFLASGKYVDALKNKYTLPVEQMEETLTEIEQHFELLEKNRKAKLAEARTELLKEFEDCNPEMYPLGDMTKDQFIKLLKDQQDLKAFKIERAQKEAIEQEKAKQKADLEEQRTSETILLTTYIPNYNDIFLSELSEDEYQTLLLNAQNAKKEFDDQQKKLAEENAKLKAENEAKEKAAAAAKAKADAVLKQQQEEAAAKLKAEQDKAAKEKAEATAKAEALQKELNDKKAAEEKAAAEQAEKLKAENEAKRKASLAPDKDKLIIMINNMKLDTPVLSSEESVKIFNDISTKFKAFQKWSNEQIDTLK